MDEIKIEIRYYGPFWFAWVPSITRQYIGSGKTKKEAEEDAKTNLKRWGYIR